jgi:hypothetical protein
MTSRNRFGGLVVTVLVASLVLAAGRARAATIIHFEGEFSSGGLSGINTAISINQPGNDYAAGTGQEKIFYLSFGSVSSTLDPSSQWNTLPLNNLTINLSAFTVDNPFGSVTAFGIVDTTLLQVKGPSAPPNADFTMAATAQITTNQVDHATIEIPVTLRLSSDGNGDDLSAFNTAGGGIFTIDIDNIQITQPTTDGKVLFPVDPGNQVTVHWSINPVPEPSSAVSMFIGAGLMALWVRKKRMKAEG